MLSKNTVFIFMSLIILWFVTIEYSPTIGMPELMNDEACTGTVTLRLIRNIRGNDYIRLFGRYFQLSDNGHHGAMENYILAPFLFFGGATLEALRTAPVILGIGTLVLCYYVSSTMFNPFVGIVSTLLLATNTSFILLEKMGGFFGFTIPFFTLSALLFFVKWHNSERLIYLYSGMFLLGLGFNVKAYYIWFIISFFVGGLLLYPKNHKIKIRVFLIGTAIFLLAALPILSVYCKSDFSKRLGLKGFITGQGFNMQDVIGNMSARIGHLNLILEGSLFWGDSSLIDRDYRLIAVFIFWLCVTGLLCLVFIKRKTSLPRRRIIFVMMLVLAMLVISVFSFTILRKGHFIILLPYIQLLMGIGLFEFLNFSQRRIIRIAVVLLISGLLTANLTNCGQMYKMLKQESIDKAACNVAMLSRWLLDNEIYSPVCFTPGLLEFSSDLKISPQYYPWYLVNNQPDIKNRLWRTIEKGSRGEFFVFGLSADGNAQSVFTGFAKELNKKAVKEKEFLWASGKPRFTVYSLR